MSHSTRPGPMWLAAAATSALVIVLLLGLPTAPAVNHAAALRVQLDPETGEIVPVTGLDKAELDRQMSQMLNRSSAGLREVRHADGSVSVDLEGRFQSLSVATTDSTGAVRTRCVTNGQESREFFDGAGTPCRHDGTKE
jgi:hypothetical protein